MIQAERLQHIGDHVAVGENGGLGDAGGAAGVLQKGDVLAGPSGTGSSLRPRPLPKALLNGTAPGMLHGGICLRTCLQHEIHDEAAAVRPTNRPMPVTSTFFKSVCANTCCSTCAKFSTMTMAFAPESFS